MNHTHVWFLMNGRRKGQTPVEERMSTVSKVQAQIHVLRGQRVMLDADLAVIYGVPVKRLNEQVKRNLSRFPADFMFQLTLEEGVGLRSQFATTNKRPSDDKSGALRSQFATLEKGRGGRRYLPFAFTEQGIAMLSSVLHSERAIQANIEIMRAFVALRHWVLSYDQLQRRLEEMEGRYDGHFKLVFKALRQVLKEEAKPQKRIGF